MEILKYKEWKQQEQRQRQFKFQLTSVERLNDGIIFSMGDLVLFEKRTLINEFDFGEGEILYFDPDEIHVLIESKGLTFIREINYVQHI